MTVNEFIRKVKYDIMLSSLDIPLMVDGNSIKDVEILEDEHFGYYFNIKTKDQQWKLNSISNLRYAQAAFESELDRKYRGNTWFMSTEEMTKRQELCNKVFDLTTEVDEYLKKIE